MPSHRILILLVISCVIGGFLGCERDPNIRKQKFLESGSHYFVKEEFPAAVVEFSNALQIDPNFAPAHFQLAECFLKMQRFPEAYRELQRTIELDSRNQRALLDLGIMFIAGRNYDQAQSTALGMLQSEPSSPDAHLLLSELHRARGEPALALQEIKQAIALDPNRAQLYVQLGTLQSGNGNLLQAENSFQKALQLDPKFVSANEALASLYEGSNRWTDSETQLRKAIQVAPTRINIRKHLALLYYSQKRTAEAEQVMVQAKKDLGRTGDNYRVLGEYYNNIGEADKSLAEFALISKEHPDDLRTKEDYIRLLLSHGRIEEARDLNDAIVEAYPRDTGALVIRSTMLNADGKYGEAAQILEGALHDAQEDAYGHYQYGIALSKTGSLERAKQEWFEAAKLAPQISEVQLALAEAARQNGDIGLLRETAEQLIRNRPLDPRGYVLRAESETKGTLASAAEQDLQKAIELAPQDGSVYTAMGKFYRGQAKSKEALEYYERALDRDPRAIEPLAGIVSILAGEKQSAKALARVQAQATKSPNNDALFVLLGGLQLENKDLAGAQVSLQRASGINPHNVDAATLLSKVEMARGERDEALATAYRAITDNPRAAIACFSAATLEELLGNTPKAEELYRKALELEPGYAQAANNLAYLMLQNREDPDGALPLAMLARKKMPDSSSAADTLAWVYYHKGLYGFAADLLREALQKNPNNATYHYHLGMVYQKQSNKLEARKHLQRALQINPSYPAAEQIRSTLNQIS
jgi:tetratricopeptide (TPR) repeat protein